MPRVIIDKVVGNQVLMRLWAKFTCSSREHRFKPSFYQCLVVAVSGWLWNCSWYRDCGSIDWCRFRHRGNARRMSWCCGASGSVATICQRATTTVVVVVSKGWRAVLTINVETFQCSLGYCTETRTYLGHYRRSFGSFIFYIFILSTSHSVKSSSIVWQVVFATKPIYWSRIHRLLNIKVGIVVFRLKDGVQEYYKTLF